MTNPSKAKGTKFETDVLNYLRSAGLDVERLALTGSQDEGDKVVRLASGLYEVCEDKAESRYDIPRYLRELDVEVENFRKRRGLESYQVNGVVHLKLRGRPIGQCAAITTIDRHWGIR